MKTEKTKIVEHSHLVGDYRLLVLDAPEISAQAVPGQFVHVRIPQLEESALRRPFSLYKAENSTISILYKVVGRGTAALATAAEGSELDVMGPFGNGFPIPGSEVTPLLVAGGYGVAPLYLMATRCLKKGVLFVGGATAEDILCIDEFEKLGWDVRVATMDGTLGSQGLVTDVLDEWLTENSARNDYSPAGHEIFACGPDGMLKALGDRAIAGEFKGWLSLDKHMGCGVGACLACVQKLQNVGGDEYWGRVCKDGPVFESREIVWESSE
ncbi:MAG: dihydroorotate dehydrogenase electron transfer subunit [Kiritimatiellae bacterium]|nr:dihydroorotate dehydrogenase electron transfer subunit [Kiritimatiellia bacterium]